ncbi:hypothetical protein KY285_020851 [Solanum tuberosum]|nr:hypothetical protein KY285_020851 [Solanum tuberosum]
MEQAETYGVDKRCACQCCGEKEKADGGDSLACDSCEEIYHLSCVEPTVKGNSCKKLVLCQRNGISP